MSPAHSLAHRGRLLVSCPDRPGIVAGVSQFLFSRGANIVHSDQHSTAHLDGRFFLRIEFEWEGEEERAIALKEDFEPVARAFHMEWQIRDVARPSRIAIFVSQHDHCLLELLWQQRAGDLRAEIACIVSNHPDSRETAAMWGVPFHYIPVGPENKALAEQMQEALLEGAADLIVLARYMQILSGAFVQRWPHRIINIHHSFLPAFAGARPYHQAHERGVKLIGATAHYVTEDLDAGPIIEQDVQRVDHRHTPDDLRRMGRAIERVVLARAVRWHVEDRILVHGNKTVVFS